MSERHLRDRVVDYAHRLHARGWVANHDGNITAKFGPGRFVATPTATSKAAVVHEGLIVVDDQGKVVGGRGKPFSELGLHLTAYAQREDVAAVIHAHPPCATALACAGSNLLARPFMAEAVVSLGPSIPTVPFAAPGLDACTALAPFVADHDAMLLSSHGVLTLGVDIEQAYLRMELVEHLSKIALEATKVGGIRPLPDAAIEQLMAARARAGLGPSPGSHRKGTVGASLRGAAAPSVVACAPTPDANVDVRPLGSSPAPALADIIREELVRALRER